ncbi:hypothetical protein BC829DRAFT_431447 [Chytridium lagenaria]|nr:hypothetical protein BC829DRAFT_431447 [Chytridium lagenaria]
MSALAAQCARFDTACTQAVAAISPANRAGILGDCTAGSALRLCRACSPTSSNDDCLEDPSGFLVQVPNYPMHLWEGRMPSGSKASQKIWRDQVYAQCTKACASTYPAGAIISSQSFGQYATPSNVFVTACTCEDGKRVPPPYQIAGLKLTPAIEGLPGDGNTTQTSVGVAVSDVTGVATTAVPVASGVATTSTPAKTSGSKKVAAKWVVATIAMAACSVASSIFM